ncbi:MAG: hypothetical protein LBB17_03415, partial [Puniceicoccales bacterium]|nr:hypothetical protein [Puniceicoccales bacterium]
MITFSANGEDNVPANDFTNPFIGSGYMRNISVSGNSPAHGIYFSGGNFPGKILTLVNGGVIDTAAAYLISATANGSPENNRYRAAAMDLGGVQGGEGLPFTVALDNADGPKEYRFSAQANDRSGANAYAVAVGVPYAASTTTANYLTFDPRGARVIATATATATESSACAALFGAGQTIGGTFSQWTVGSFGDGANLSATAESSFAYAALFGAGQTIGGCDFSHWMVRDSGGVAFGARANLSTTATSSRYSASAALFGAGEASGNFSHWTVGSFGANANLFTTANSSMYYTCAALFGAGEASGNFSHWTVGSFGDGANLSVTANSSGNSASASAALFGTGYASIGGDFSHWTMGSFGDGANLSATATSSGSSARAALFGAGQTYGDPTFDDWTVEFLGSGTMTTAGYHPYSGAIYLGTLGGDRNSNFRFYFNNGDAGEATVNIAALKLGAPVVVAAGQATMTLADDQGSGTYARAIALGPNFQLNIGRARELGPQREDATCETEDSIASGGHPSGGTGTMNIFGAIAKARMSDGTAGSIIRIDSGWTVNAYGPVEDIASIAVNDGTFNTYDSLKNITLSSGNVNAYGTSDGIGTITLNGGNLSIARCDNNNFAKNFGGLKSGMRYVAPDGTKYSAGEENSLTIND